ncbi:hypothetical protein FXO37_04650 [Capsicum annuum]|nr:hypothetical protein FXO37_04650 [Capsicum annuum]
MKAISSTVIVNIYQIKSSFICLQVCVSSVDPTLFPAVVETGALMILNLTRETKRLLSSVILSVTMPHTLSLPDQDKLAEQLELEGVDIIQTKEGKCSTPSKAGVLRLIEKAVNIPVMCSSGLSAVTAPMAIIAGATDVICLTLSFIPLHCLSKVKLILMGSTEKVSQKISKMVILENSSYDCVYIVRRKQLAMVLFCLDCCYALLVADMLGFPLSFGPICDVIERVRDIRVQKGVVLDSPPTNDDDDDIDS